MQQIGLFINHLLMNWFIHESDLSISFLHWHKKTLVSYPLAFSGRQVCMEARFRHWMKNAKGNGTFYLTIMSFFLRIAWYKLAIARHKVAILRNKIRTVRYKLAILRTFQSSPTQNLYIMQFWLHNSQLRVYIMQFWEMYNSQLCEKSKNCEIKSCNNLFNFFYSVAETGFHRFGKMC